ncbi:hypothetical protein LJR235_004726 [Pararhizobium sp. LjRoot235]|uniref:hypothetical protein n=1 Tax=Pararhizobium sp. LjRoot235 TaxID=3342291 RepID=UPI003ECF818F
MRKACNIRPVLSRLWLIVVVMAVAAVYGGQPVFGQTPTPVSEQKIDQLIKLLDDPEVRALLSKSATAPASPAAEPAADMSAATFSAWGNRIRQHLRDIGQAVPQVSSEFMRAGSKIAAEINGHGPFGVFVLFLTLILIGLGAEWLFHRIASRSRARAALTLDDGTGVKPLYRVGHHLFAVLAPLVAFSFASLGLFMAMTWPPLLDAIMLPLLLGVIACRFVIRIARLLLVGPPSAEGPGAPLGLAAIDPAAGAFWYKRIVWFSCILFAGWALAGVMTALHILPAVRGVVVYLLGLGLLLVGIETVWNRPAALARGRGAMEWALTAFLCLLWGLWVAGVIVILWLGIYALILPGLLQTTTATARNAFAAKLDAPQGGNPVFEVLVERGARAGIIALAIAWLAFLVNKHTSMFTGEAMTDRLRGCLKKI